MWTKRVAHYGLVSALILTGKLVVDATGARRVDPSADAAPHITDAAYRDGLFQGKLAARRCGEKRPGVGRWGGDAERAHFALGYERGYEYAADTAACAR